MQSDPPAAYSFKYLLEYKVSINCRMLMLVFLRNGRLDISKHDNLENHKLQNRIDARHRMIEINIIAGVFYICEV